MNFQIASLSLSLCAAVNFASAAPVNILPKELSGAVQPQVTVARNGRVHLTFGKGADIFHSSSANGREYSAPVKVTDLPNLALGKSWGPRIAAAEKSLIVTAISNRDGMIHCWQSTDDGKTWREQPVMNSLPKSASEGLQDIADDGAGLIAIGWVDMRNTGGEVWIRVSKDGGTTWDDERCIYASPSGSICACCHPSLAIGPKGEIGVMWRNKIDESRDMWLTTSVDGGKTFAAPHKLGTGTWKLDRCPMDGGSLGFDSKGTPLAAWTRDGQVFTSATSDREDQLSKSGAQPVIHSGKSGTIAIWEQNGGLMLKRASGEPSSFAAKGSSVSAASMTDGKVIVAWETPDGAIMADVIE